MFGLGTMLIFSSLSSAGLKTPELPIIREVLHGQGSLGTVTHAAELLRLDLVDNGDDENVDSLFMDDIVEEGLFESFELRCCSL